MASTIIHLLEKFVQQNVKRKRQKTNYHNTGYRYCYENLCCVQYHRQENKT
jgi:hypothetical protein